MAQKYTAINLTGTTSNIEFPQKFVKGGDAPPVTMGVSAVEAARELRSALQHLRHYAPKESRLSKHNREKLLLSIVHARNELAFARGGREPLAEAAKARKSADVQRIANELFVHLSQLELALNELDYRISGIPPAGPGEHDFDRLYQLAQCLPTVEDLPRTPAENTLRAIIALLRQHRWPGLEGVTQNPQEVTNGSEKEAVEQLAAAVGPPQPVGAYPGTGADDGGEDDGAGDDEYHDDDA